MKAIDGYTPMVIFMIDEVVRPEEVCLVASAPVRFIGLEVKLFNQVLLFVAMHDPYQHLT